MNLGISRFKLGLLGYVAKPLHDPQTINLAAQNNMVKCATPNVKQLAFRVESINNNISQDGRFKITPVLRAIHEVDILDRTSLGYAVLAQITAFKMAFDEIKVLKRGFASVPEVAESLVCVFLHVLDLG